MPVKFSKEFDVKKADILRLGVFDVILDVDTRVSYGATPVQTPSLIHCQL